MAAAYLHFLYPPVFRAVESPAGARSAHGALHLKSIISQRKFHVANGCRQDAFVQRYGPAAELPPPPIMTKAQTEQSKKPPENDKPGSKEAMPRKNPEKKADPLKSKPNNSLALTSEGLPQILDVNPNPQPSSIDPKAIEAEAERLQESTRAARDKEPQSLDKVLQEQAPTELSSSTMKGQTGSSKPPHLHAPPYVHHFDSFGLVKDLEKGGFQLNQAETLMKAVRSLLAVNLDVAKEGMVSKSDRENVRMAAISRP